MTRNVGSIDRAVRIVIGLVLIAYGVVAKSWIGAIGIVPIATALIGWCPIYLPFGLSSCRAKTR